jgi:myo-inositol-1(or 4)-monophosphatase
VDDAGLTATMSADERIGSEARQQVAAGLTLRGGRMALDSFHRARNGADCRRDDVEPAGAVIGDRLAAEIAAVYPGDAVLGAPGAPPAGRMPARYSWVVGPVDGLGDLERGLPGFTVSIGVLREHRPFVGAVYDPISRWLFTACAGRGAWLNDRPLRVGSSSLSRASLVAVGTPLDGGVPPVVREWLGRYRLRRTGSTALQLCYAAMGALDLVHDHRTSLREVAGAAAVVLEAGGVITLADGGSLFPPSPAQVAGAPLAVLAGNPTSHGQALADVVGASSNVYGRVIVS